MKVDKAAFDNVLAKLLASAPMPKAAISPKTAHPKKAKKKAQAKQ